MSPCCIQTPSCPLSYFPTFLLTPSSHHENINTNTNVPVPANKSITGNEVKEKHHLLPSKTSPFAR